jgi:hypothetical protein
MFMAKIKPTSGKKTASNPLAKPGFAGGLGCIIVVVSGLLVVFLLIYYSIAKA